MEQSWCAKLVSEWETQNPWQKEVNNALGKRMIREKDVGNVGSENH